MNERPDGNDDDDLASRARDIGDVFCPFFHSPSFLYMSHDIISLSSSFLTGCIDDDDDP